MNTIVNIVLKIKILLSTCIMTTWTESNLRQSVIIIDCKCPCYGASLTSLFANVCQLLSQTLQINFTGIVWINSNQCILSALYYLRNIMGSRWYSPSRRLLSIMSSMSGDGWGWMSPSCWSTGESVLMIVRLCCVCSSSISWSRRELELTHMWS